MHTPDRQNYHVPESYSRYDMTQLYKRSDRFNEQSELPYSSDDLSFRVEHLLRIGLSVRAVSSTYS